MNSITYSSAVGDHKDKINYEISGGEMNIVAHGFLDRYYCSNSNNKNASEYYKFSVIFKCMYSGEIEFKRCFPED